MVPKIGIVGMGGFAETHVLAAAELESAGRLRQIAQVAVATDRQTYGAEIEALQRRGVMVHGSLREMLATQRRVLDLVVIPTGIPLHRPMAEAALAAGCHVLLEKPVAGSIQDFDAVEATAARCGRWVAVGFQHLSRPDVAAAKELVCAGRLGRIRYARAAACWPRDPAYYRRNNWAGRLAVADSWVLDSPHQNALAHALNLLCYLGCERPGEALTPQWLEAELYHANLIDSADTVALRVGTDRGVEVFFAASHAVERSVDPTLVIGGDLGLLQFNYQGGGRVRWEDGRTLDIPAQAGPGSLADACAAAARQQAGPACPLALARPHCLCVCASFESAAVLPFPPDQRRQRSDSGLMWVHGLTDLVLQAGTEGALFSELGARWAVRGERLDLAGYTYLPTWRLPGGPPAA